MNTIVSRSDVNYFENIKYISKAGSYNFNNIRTTILF